MRVVVADDFGVVLPRLTSFVETLGNFRVVATADNGHDAWVAICELQPDLALLDFQMPGLNGVEVVERIRAAGLPTRVVIVSQYDGPELRSCCLAAGANGFVSKHRVSSDLAAELARVRDPESNQQAR
jgi:DNA-binding NarL/FixJ family response regulator